MGENDPLETWTSTRLRPVFVTDTSQKVVDDLDGFLGWIQILKYGV